MLARFTQEAVSRLDPITLPHFNLSVLNHMSHILAKEHLFERFHGLYIALLERDESKTSAPPSHLVTHNGDIDNLAEPFEVGLHIGLYSHIGRKKRHKQSDNRAPNIF